MLRGFLDVRRARRGEFAALFATTPRAQWVALDLETTGLDTRRDAVLSIAAVPVDPGGVRLSQRFERAVRPERDFGIESIRHHRLLPGELAQAQPLDRVVHELLHWLGPRSLIGFHLRFDLAMLAPALRRVLGARLPNRCIDVAHVYERSARLALPRGDLDLSLDAVARALAIEPLARHSALGDACTTALIWLALRARGAH